MAPFSGRSRVSCFRRAFSRFFSHTLLKYSPARRFGVQNLEICMRSNWTHKLLFGQLYLSWSLISPLHLIGDLAFTFQSEKFLIRELVRGLISSGRSGENIHPATKTGELWGRSGQNGKFISLFGSSSRSFAENSKKLSASSNKIRQICVLLIKFKCEHSEDPVGWLAVRDPKFGLEANFTSSSPPLWGSQTGSPLAAALNLSRNLFGFLT